MSKITTHVLDTSQGKPAADMTVFLYHSQNNNEWEAIGGGATNEDGRLPDMLAEDAVLTAGIYKLKFATEEYYEGIGMETLYPYVEIVFYLGKGGHYHVPLLLSPYGYSTCKGA
ncbi:MAG TPA: hydroxyisourate hydrolase [Chitinophaga sp.]|uniref:hydroxyisourate hydrolase n=1 Tax=Chitinophaga sp. TaxID=1869181 RepID=UPI002DB99913|nr:hydroxyisourate hydrolase [Chitinophaga sp.]HEU4553671.1 hydroxyisourate hydrolase [Chitinophaga sp.]